MPRGRPRTTTAPREPANRIAALRAARGMTQQQLADIVGCEASTIYRLESGRRELTGAKILAIADALGVHPGELFRPLPPHPDMPDLSREQLEALAALVKPRGGNPAGRRRA